MEKLNVAASESKRWHGIWCPLKFKIAVITHLMTRQVDLDILPQLVSGELVVDKILELLLESCHKISA